MRTYDDQRFPDTPFQRYLAKKWACCESRTWAGTKTAQEAWDQCENEDWLYYWISELERKEVFCDEDVIEEYNKAESRIQRCDVFRKYHKCPWTEPVAQVR